MISLNTPLAEAKGIGPKFQEKLKKLRLETIKDLLWYFPFRYEDFSNIVAIKDLKIGQHATIQGIIQSIKLRRTWKRRMFIVEALISDETGNIRAVWFNQRFLITMLKKGSRVNLAGKITEAPEGGLVISHPVHEILTYKKEAGDLRHTGRVVPVYPEIKGLTSKGIRFLIKPLIDKMEKIEDPLPKEILEKQKIFDIDRAIRNIHFPGTIDDAKEAKKRFAFEDLFFLQLNNLRQRMKLAKERAYSSDFNIDEVKELLAKLPFELTYSQKKSLWEILKDLKKPHPMNRLLQGDVGSGKTIVAILAALVLAEESKQTAFMAPTEVLAKQHYDTFKKFFKEFDKGAGLITGSMAKVFYGDGLENDIKKNDLIGKIENGEIKIVFGTHALIQKYVRFGDLALVIIDEQHRFGVKQRRALLRGTNAEQTRNNIKETEYNNELLYKDLTYKIRSALFDVKKELGGGHKEIVYQKALVEAFKKNGINFSREEQIPIFYRNKKVGVYVPDFIIEDKIIIELKALTFVGAIEKKQIRSYLKGSKYRLALLANYGPKELTINRIVYDFTRDSAFVLRSSASIPHLLSMSATPIPRTLSLTVFGDLDLSIIDELPKGRKEIITKIVAPANRDKAYAFIRGQVKKGRQVFVICPRIELTQKNAEQTQNAAEITDYSASVPQQFRVRSALWENVKMVKEEYEKLSKKVFPDLRVAMLHGKMKAKEKNEIMRSFQEHKTDILVSTSVIEVGVDVSNATIMMIEDADKFGLAQLYQFRGRVGRGEHQSFCFLLTESASKSTYQRLRSLIEAKNGFELAEKDLAIRGPGEFLGEEQTGVPDLAMKAVKNPELVKSSREAAEEILKTDPELKNYPLLKKRLENFAKEVHLE
jgi:GxxExxY protein